MIRDEFGYPADRVIDPRPAQVASNIKAMATEFYRPSTRPRVAKGTFVLGICGPARAGKNTVADHIVSAYGRLGRTKVPANDGPLDVRAYALADALKAEVFDWLEGFHGGTTREFLVNSTYPHPEPMDASKFGWGVIEKVQWVDSRKAQLRFVLQRWGTEYRRTQDDSYWIDRLLERIAEDSPQIALITDCRFANEAAICHVTMKVERLGEPGVDAKVFEHVSETELNSVKFKYVVQAQAGDIVGLKAAAEKVFEQILKDFHVQ